MARIAAIEYPPGQTLGRPGDVAGQQAVLRATIQALESIQTAGGMVGLPFAWPGAAEDLPSDSPQPPPIVRHILRYPWQLQRLLRREVPG